MGLLSLTEELTIPGIENLPGFDKITKKKIDSLKENAFELMKDVADKRAKKDPHAKDPTSAILLVIGNYSIYPDLPGVISLLYQNQPIKTRFNIADENIDLGKGHTSLYTNFSELADNLSLRVDGFWLAHLDGTILGCGYYLEHNPHIMFDDMRGTASKAAKHQASLPHVVMSLHLSGTLAKKLRRYEAMGEPDPLMDYANIVETTYDPYSKKSSS